MFVHPQTYLWRRQNSRLALVAVWMTVKAIACLPARVDLEGGQQKAMKLREALPLASFLSLAPLLPLSHLSTYFPLCHLPTHFLKEMPQSSELCGKVMDAVWR